MEAWRPQRFLQVGQDRGVEQAVLANAVATGKQIVVVDRDLPPVFTLRHLAHLAGVDYGFLRSVASRQIEDDYTVFRMRKKTRPEPRRPEFRIICVPTPALMQVQRWIAQRVLSRGKPHLSSFAYAKECGVVSAAQLHCQAQWLIKLDVRRFFESISELAVFRAFRALGYQPLVAFEFARICTRVGSTRGADERWCVHSARPWTIAQYQRPQLGHLPQGAPTSPMLSNFAMVGFDEDVSNIAANHGLVYTRYADDLCLSTRKAAGFGRAGASRVIRDVYRAMARAGLSPNISKTRVVPPGARKVVLGLVVDGDRPRLPREFRDRLRQHLYYLARDDIGPVRHAAERDFAAVQGLQNHVTGLVAFACQVDPDFGERCQRQLDSVKWPFE